MYYAIHVKTRFQYPRIFGRKYIKRFWRWFLSIEGGKEMIYRTTKCPSCGYILAHDTGLKEGIGHPVGKCPSCQKLYKTGMKYWKDMDGFERTSYMLKRLFQIFITLIYGSVINFLIALFVLRLLDFIFKLDLSHSPMIFTLMIIIIPIYVLYKLITHTIKLMRLSEKDININI